jgi:hypothetical protein
MQTNLERQTKVILSGDSSSQGIGSHLQDTDIEGLVLVHRQADIIKGNQHIAKDNAMLTSDPHRKKVLVASYGLDDLRNNKFTPRWKLDSMVAAMKDLGHNTEACVLAIPPQKDLYIQKIVTEANRFLKDRCEEVGSVHFIDSGLTASDIGRDGTHLNINGIRKVAKGIKDFVHYL